MKSAIVVLFVFVNIADLWVNDMPFTNILRLVRRNAPDDYMQLGLLVVVLLPSSFIYYALHFNWTLMLLQDLELSENVAENLCPPSLTLQVRSSKILPEVDEAITTISTGISCDGADGNSEIFPSANLEIKINQCKQMNRTHLKVCSLRMRADHILSDLTYWHILTMASDYPPYMLYHLSGEKQSHLSSTMTNCFYAVQIFTNIAPLFINILIGYKKYYTHVKTTRQIFLSSNKKIERLLSKYVKQGKTQYLHQSQKLAELDSSVFNLMSDFAFLLMTTFIQ